MSNPIVITRDTVSRPLAELDPKIAIAMIFGFLTLVAVIVAHSLKVALPFEVYAAIPVTFSLICGYITKGTGTTITQFNEEGAKISEETHHGPTVTTVTASVPIQAPKRGTFTDVIAQAPAPAETVEQKTEVLPPSSAFAAARGYTPPMPSGSSEDSH